MDAHKKMMEDMAMKSTDDADKGFAMMMIPYRRDRIDIAELSCNTGKTL
ncbi:MAG: hypothetical protein ACOZAM_09470 [Pseudomonadota bacterium]